MQADAAVMQADAPDALQKNRENNYFPKNMKLETFKRANLKLQRIRFGWILESSQTVEFKSHFKICKILQF